MAKKNRKIYKGNEINQTFSYGVIYIYSIPDERHRGRLKIGSATITSLSPTQEEIDLAAHQRIKNQTQTADVPFKLEYTLLSVTEKGDYFSDNDVHNVLIRSGFPRKSKSTNNSKSEWFEISLDIAKKAINAVKEGRKSLTTEERTTSKIFEFPFRPNQREAIDITTKAIKKNRKQFLWNAKMRFGKTSAAMQIAKENEMKKVLIVTHRPSVSVDWDDDFKNVFFDTDYQYSSKTKGENISTLIKDKKAFVYFASLQDLRGSKRVVEDELSGSSRLTGFDKNDEVFDTNWDMVIIDEAHEGTQSSLGDTTFLKIPKNFTLRLSGTPFNILHKYEEEDVYTWDYVMEQEKKLNWDNDNPGVPNPYAELPALSIFTYDIDTFASHIGSLGENFHDSLDGAFKFYEFFRVKKDDNGNDIAEFVYESMVKNFLDLLVDDSSSTKFPYATEEYRSYNKHSLWLLPNRIKVIEAMEKLLKGHPVFGVFGIVNISGNNRDDEEDKDAKDRVTRAIKNNDYTITLTGQRLTTGASIPEWTAVFMMSDTSSATTYLQTAFRCQTPAKIDGKIKTQGYVFDFAPDRTLRLIAEAIELNHKSGKTNSPEQKDAMRQFLNFCPILAAKGGTMKSYDVEAMIGQLKKAIIERVSRNGFDDPKLYNDELLKLDGMDISKFNELKAIIGTSSSERINEIKINELGMDELQIQKSEEDERKKKQKQELTKEQKEALKKLKEAREQKRNAINILRAVSIRMPMLVYGANVLMKDDITLEKFIDLVDKESWKEFMPMGLTKEKFKDFTKYYDEDVFKGVTRSIRAKAFDCDNLLPTERIQAIAEIFKTFKNPDKETVLTPWNVVNMHMTKAFGGHDFCSGVTDKTRDKPEWKSGNIDANIWSQDNIKILEINSKSGLYPLLVAYNIYSRQLKNEKGNKSEEKLFRHLWNKVLENNIFVLCKSPMAKSITFRTLAGYNKGIKTNIIYIEDLVKKLQQKEKFKNYNLKDELLEKFNLKDKNMKFTAVVGNPPYQGENHQQIYPYFYLASRELGEYVSLIFPTGWQSPKNANNLRLLNNKNIKNDHQIVFIDNRQNVFPGIPGAEWTNIILWKKDHNNGLQGSQKIYTNGKNPQIILLPIEQNHDKKPKEIREMAKIVKSSQGFVSMQTITSSLKPYGLRTDFFDNPLKYNLPAINENKKNKNDLTIYGLKNRSQTKKFIPLSYPLPKVTNAIYNYKVFIGKAWGNWSNNYLGGAYSDIIIAKPNDICTENFLESGNFNDFLTAQKHAKYLMTKFLRALLFLNKYSQDNSKEKFKDIPLQDYSEAWWNKTVKEIDIELMEKYKIPKNIKDFVMKNIQKKSENNIVGYF